MNVAIHTIECFAGVGMLGVGLRAGLGHLGLTTRTVCYVEREAFAASVMAARMAEGALDDAPVWTDVTSFDATAWRGSVDCVIGGFPCQDLSLAGRRAGLDGKRSGLFFDLLRIAEDSGARYLFLENVAGIASATATVVDEAEGELEERAAARVLGELADRGWSAEWLTLSASDVGASHGRARWFCWAWRDLAHAERPERRALGVCGIGGEQGNDGGRREAHGGPGVAGEVLGNAHQQRQQQPHDTDRAQPRGDARPGAGGSGGLMECEFCGYAFPESCGRYGCPNCECDGLADTTGHGRHQGRPKSGGIEGRPDAAECGGAVAHTSGPRQQRPELGTTRNGNRGGQETHGSVSQLRGAYDAGLFAPGPTDPRWAAILAAEPWRAPAIDKAAESLFCGTPDGLARGLDFSNRAARLKCCGNGVVPLQAAAAAVVLVRRMIGPSKSEPLSPRLSPGNAEVTGLGRNRSNDD